MDLRAEYVHGEGRREAFLHRTLQPTPTSTDRAQLVVAEEKVGHLREDMVAASENMGRGHKVEWHLWPVSRESATTRQARRHTVRITAVNSRSRLLDVLELR